MEWNGMEWNGIYVKWNGIYVKWNDKINIMSSLVIKFRL